MKRFAPLLVVALLAGCGSTERAAPRQPHLPRALAAPWRAQADAVAAALAANDGCVALQRAVALRTSVITAINAHRLAPRFQEPLQSAVNDLASRITCIPPAPPPAAHGHDKHHEKHHGKHKK
jgi:hypothetical protein